MRLYATNSRLKVIYESLKQAIEANKLRPKVCYEQKTAALQTAVTIKSNEHLSFYQQTLIDDNPTLRLSREELKAWLQKTAQFPTVLV